MRNHTTNLRTFARTHTDTVCCLLLFFQISLGLTLSGMSHFYLVFLGFYQTLQFEEKSHRPLSACHSVSLFYLGIILLACYLPSKQGRDISCN